jgi:hypothetical protein
MAIPIAVPARGALTASGAPKSAITRQAAGRASFTACSTRSFLVSVPDRCIVSM